MKVRSLKFAAPMPLLAGACVLCQEGRKEFHCFITGRSGFQQRLCKEVNFLLHALVKTRKI